MSQPASSAPMTRLPTEQEEILEEALSEIYECRESKQITRAEIEPVIDKKVRAGALAELVGRRYVVLKGEELTLAPEGERIAIGVIRRKRLAERLLKDVLNVKDEFIDPAACQWEHILSREVTNSICTILGHPKQSPRDLPIPEGDCCRQATKTAAPVVRALADLRGGDRARISYLLLKQNPDLHRLLSLGIVPGTDIEVIQRFPTFVVQVGESQLAFDEGIAGAIFVHPL